MVIRLRKAATQDDVSQVLLTLENEGIGANVVRYPEHTFVVTSGGDARSMQDLEAVPAVEKVVQEKYPFKLASRAAKAERSIVDVGGVKIGGEEIVVMAGPCSVESREQLLSTAMAVKRAGARMLRGGAYKPRTSPYEFQGLGLEALKLLAEARELTGLRVVTEVMSTEDVDLVSEYADMLQVGARNMQNFPLLRRLSKAKRPVLLKRGAAATVKEWLLAAEYILVGGNSGVVLCERGVRGFAQETRNTLDISAIVLARQLSHLPVIADPSHATGVRDLVPEVGRAAIGAGADGLMIEVHPDPDKALSDGPQSLTFAQFDEMMDVIRRPLRTCAVH